MAAIEGIADAAQASLSLLQEAAKPLDAGSWPLAAVADRLRDVKPAVVRKAAEKLLWIFKTYAVQRGQGTMVSSGAAICGRNQYDVICFPSTRSVRACVMHAVLKSR